MGLNYKKVIKQITKDFKDIKFVFVKHGDQYCCANGEDYYINNSFYMPFYKEIQVGIYSN
ncbi:MAG TPA: hypothetical protein P5513_07620 [Candidatus Diapherotrites archaeon]|nr:hypothetical protein [Candidatus Diapherotrites archaeon]